MISVNCFVILGWAIAILGLLSHKNFLVDPSESLVKGRFQIYCTIYKPKLHMYHIINTISCIIPCPSVPCHHVSYHALQCPVMSEMCCSTTPPSIPHPLYWIILDHTISYWIIICYTILYWITQDYTK